MAPVQRMLWNRAAGGVALALSDEQRHHVTVCCTGSPEEHLNAIAVLYEMLTGRLGPPDLESA